MELSIKTGYNSMQCMARKKTGTTTKLQPAEMTLASSMSVPFGITTFTADLSQMASIVNRRFYRQGLNWAVAGFKVRIVGTGQGSVLIKKLPTTWTFANSWTKGFRHWQEMNKRATDDGDVDVGGRFLDFKIYADSTHHTAGFGNNLLPNDGVTVATEGSWIPSEVVVPSGLLTSGYEVIGVGDNYPGASPASGKDAVSLVQGYANSRRLPYEADPNTPAESDDASGAAPENWITALGNEGTGQDALVLEDMRAYDKPPYPFEGDGTATTTQYPGGASQMPNMVVHDVTDLTATTISGTSRLKGGNFPCGLVRFEVQNTGAQDLNLALLIDLVPGTHRGYLAEPMTEM